jgi:adenylate cyclase
VKRISSAFTPHVATGVNTGEMISGNIGSETLRRLNYTVIGDVVNTAVCLQSIAQEGQILITGRAHKKISESFQCRKIGEVPLKNKAKPTELYEVLG